MNRAGWVFIEAGVDRLDQEDGLLPAQVRLAVNAPVAGIAHAIADRHA